MWGEHDQGTVGLLLGAMAEAVATDDLDVMVDLSDVAFMDGSTVGALDRGRALLADRDRNLTVQSPTPFQRRLLQICDLADLIEPTRAGERSQEPGAATPLETWVEVPADRRVTSWSAREAYWAAIADHASEGAMRSASDAIASATLGSVST